MLGPPCSSGKRGKARFYAAGACGSELSTKLSTDRNSRLFSTSEFFDHRGITIAHARTLLLRLKTGNSLKFTFISDDHDVSHIPAWVKTAKQTTDGHLAQLAKTKSAILATLDERIPGAFLIPYPKVK
jgi:hypothetical protein